LANYERAKGHLCTQLCARSSPARPLTETQFSSRERPGPPSTCQGLGEGVPPPCFQPSTLPPTRRMGQSYSKNTAGFGMGLYCSILPAPCGWHPGGSLGWKMLRGQGTGMVPGDSLNMHQCTAECLILCEKKGTRQPVGRLR
jgi:hypothetical protein